MKLGKLGPDVHSQGNTSEVPVTDDETTSLLTRLLTEMKIMNLHLAMMTDNNITAEDVE